MNAAPDFERCYVSDSDSDSESDSVCGFKRHGGSIEPPRKYRKALERPEPTGDEPELLIPLRIAAQMSLDDACRAIEAMLDKELNDYFNTPAPAAE